MFCVWFGSIRTNCVKLWNWPFDICFVRDQRKELPVQIALLQLTKDSTKLYTQCHQFCHLLSEYNTKNFSSLLRAAENIDKSCLCWDVTKPWSGRQTSQEVLTDTRLKAYFIVHTWLLYSLVDTCDSSIGTRFTMKSVAVKNGKITCYQIIWRITSTHSRLLEEIVSNYFPLLKQKTSQSC